MYITCQQFHEGRFSNSVVSDDSDAARHIDAFGIAQSTKASVKRTRNYRQILPLVKI